MRIDAWNKKEHEGYYLRPLLHAYFHWNPTVHHELPGATFGKAVTKRFNLDTLSLSANRCIQRTAREHDDVLSEFGSILSGVEQTLRATGMGVRRLTDAEIFLEVKRSLNPLMLDRIPLRRPESCSNIAAHGSRLSIRISNTKKRRTSASVVCCTRSLP